MSMLPCYYTHFGFKVQTLQVKLMELHEQMSAQGADESVTDEITKVFSAALVLDKVLKVAKANEEAARAAEQTANKAKREAEQEARREARRAAKAAKAAANPPPAPVPDLEVPAEEDSAG